MNRSICLFSAIFIFAVSLPAYAEETQSNTDDSAERNRRRALIIDIDTSVREEQQVVWKETHRRTAIPGSPVGIKMAGSNVVVALQFTPIIRRHSNLLVAQWQIWVDDPGRGICYYSSIQTIPLEFGEPIYFFPLGQSAQLDSLIEIMLVVNPQTAVNISNDR